ncbi:protein RD3-like [Lepisosteus oculatus]|uniref:protein RD3-like n=1 Tax=Lepisosteus oculatus TaxID=7918 RepID=UPI0037186E28
MPLFGWMKRSRAEGERAGGRGQGAGVPGQMLIRELLWHVEERGRRARGAEREHRRAHQGGGGGDWHWLPSYPSLRSLIPASEHRQLEHLCAQIQPAHIAAVLSRFREVLAGNEVLPWELVYVFKQVLKDFLSREEEEQQQLRLMEAWTSRYQMKQSFVTPTVPDCDDALREEIPTISSYVDRSMRGACPYLAQRVWDLPFYYPAPHNCPEAYSTTL